MSDKTRLVPGVSPGRGSSRRVYFILTVAMTLLLAAMVYVLHIVNNTILRHGPLIDAAMEIRLEATSAHLWLEEILIGDQWATIDDVRKHLKEADRYAQVMLEGGEGPEGTVYPLTDPNLRKTVEEVRLKLADLEKLSEQRYAKAATSGVGTEIDQQYDALFGEIVLLSDDVETGVQQMAAGETKTFQQLQLFLIAGSLALAAFMAVTFRQYDVRRRQAEQRMQHLNAVLRAIRNVNQLITREKDRQRLIRGACDCLSESQGCYSAWIALVDRELKLAGFAQSKLGERVTALSECLQSGDLPHCGRAALARAGIVVIDDVGATCQSCPLAKDHAGRGAMAVRLEHAGRVFGWLTLSYPAGFVADRQEQALVEEVAGDIAFSLHAIEQEESAQRAEEDLRLSREQTLGILESISDGFFALDEKMVITYFNETAERLLNQKSEEVVGRHLFNEVFPEAKGSIFENNYAAALKDRKPLKFESYFGVAPYQNWYDVRVYPYQDGISIYFQITTQRKQAEEDRDRMIAELEAKNAELERFAYTVSHDLKTPLITIRGFLGLLQEDLREGNTAEIESSIARIGNATDKMRQLLSELLELSRIGRQVGPLEDVPLGDLVAEALELIAGIIAEKGVEVRVGAELPLLHGDRRRLGEVLQNLIDNAVSHMGNQPQPRIEIGAERRADQVVCYVRDNGPGIDPRYHEKIFGLFDQLDPRGEGTGIGLALAKRIVEVHGGRIWVESAGAGLGATFYFSIPKKG